MDIGDYYGAAKFHTPHPLMVPENKGGVVPKNNIWASMLHFLKTFFWIILNIGDYYRAAKFHPPLMVPQNKVEWYLKIVLGQP